MLKNDYDCRDPTFFTYDGHPGSQPPIYNHCEASKAEISLPHALDFHHCDLMVIPECQDVSLGNGGGNELTEA